MEERPEKRERPVLLSDEETHIGLVRREAVEVYRPLTGSLEGAQQ